MLGNFSFGDYFKDVAIELAWRFVTREVGLDAKRMWLTVFAGEGNLPADDEAAALWRKVSGLPASRILRLGMKDNFWAMGEVGPCGPCTEIHYDLGGKGDPTPEDFAKGRVIEIWNNVFMQFERHKDGRLTPLPKPSVDTGMGLERLAALVQGERSNYHTDLFAPILARIEECAGKRYGRTDASDDVSMRVIADHARAAAFLVADGVQPANEGRGYVMRRIMRRAIRHAKKLGIDEPFFARVCASVVDAMTAAYPELAESRALIEKVADTEEQTFRRTLDTGLAMLEGELVRLKGASRGTSTARARLTVERKGAPPVLPGEFVFKLHDTYGFPPDLTAIIAREQGLAIGDGYGDAMAAQRQRSRGSEVGEQAVAVVYKSLRARLGEVGFVGYVHEDEPLSARPGHWRLRRTDGPSYLEVETTVRALLAEGVEVDSASRDVVEVVLDPTPFYGESGGQVGDRGVI
ncbi:MAG: alanine--tRNA ligase, partial [Deltaproteobacteria bacterium]|nr:alanine--tRNA ligase [Deltaproteobacteria bacterium]